MTTPFCKPVWPTVLYASALFFGYNYGAEKQLAYFKQADAQIEKEQKLIQKYRDIYKTQVAKAKAEAEGEDPALYELPRM